MHVLISLSIHLFINSDNNFDYNNDAINDNDYKDMFGHIKYYTCSIFSRLFTSISALTQQLVSIKPSMGRWAPHTRYPL